MDINDMSAEDYLNLYCFIKLKNKQIYTDYQENFKPTREDVEEYNKKVEQFKKVWNEDKGKIHKPISFNKQEEVDEENNFEGCMEIGHKWELYIEREFAECGINLGMYYDERQFIGENEFGIEIKHDDKIQVYDRVYIEYDAINKDGSKFIDGGITKEDNSIYWLQGNESYGYFIFYKKDLYEIYKKVKLEGQDIKGCSLRCRKTSEGKITSHGVAIDVWKVKEIMIADNILEFLSKIGKI